MPVRASVPVPSFVTPSTLLLEFVFVITVLMLAWHQKMSSGLWIGVGADFVLGILFVIAYLKTPRSA